MNKEQNSEKYKDNFDSRKYEAASPPKKKGFMNISFWNSEPKYKYKDVVIDSTLEVTGTFANKISIKEGFAKKGQCNNIESYSDEGMIL